jgi:hypothetical protein
MFDWGGACNARLAVPCLKPHFRRPDEGDRQYGCWCKLFLIQSLSVFSSSHLSFSAICREIWTVYPARQRGVGRGEQTGQKITKNEKKRMVREAANDGVRNEDKQH